ncbi:MAG: methionyl-tRNA formyltransferase [Gammaproteobacteria bacterium GWF2_41_13]|nr:MAG: methionyl-tRNA formyltransferase [Gammaproteobacteria bacterium GWF2_41_13]
MKIIFAGSPDFAAKHLSALIEAQVKIAAVLTQPDKPTGRGKKVAATPVKEVALRHGISLYQPSSLKTEETLNWFRSMAPDVVIDVAYGLIIPKTILAMPHFGFLNVHPSLLPRWRGAAPIQQAILAGDTETGVSIMRLDEGIDTGPVFLQRRCLIDRKDTTASLSERLIKIGCEALLKVLANLATLNPVTQTEAGACYAPKIDKTMARLNWQESAEILDRKIRAFNPWPVAHSVLGNEVIRIWEAEPREEKTTAAEGTILNCDQNGIEVVTGKGLLRLLKLQFAGGKILSIADILNSKKKFFITHSRFES